MPIFNPGVVRISGSDALFSGTVRIIGGANITVSTDASGLSIIGGGGGGSFIGGMSNLGNSAGTSGVVSSQMLIVGGANITISQSINGQSATLTVVGPSPGAAQFSVGVSNLGNTAGSTGVTGTRIVFAGTNNISLSQSTDATGATISISGNPAFSAGLSNLGKTAGSTGVTGTRLVIAALSGNRASQSTDANGGTISIHHARQGFLMAPLSPILDSAGITVVSGTNQSLVTMIPLQGLTGALSCATFGVHLSRSSGTTAVGTIRYGIYSRNVSTLSLISSTSNSYSLTASANWQSVMRWEVTGLSALDLDPADGPFWAAVQMDFTSGAVSVMGARTAFVNFGGNIAAGANNSTTNTNAKLMPGAGTFASGGIPNSIALSAIAGNTAVRADMPVIIISEIPITI